MIHVVFQIILAGCSFEYIRHTLLPFSSSSSFRLEKYGVHMSIGSLYLYAFFIAFCIAIFDKPHWLKVMQPEQTLSEVTKINSKRLEKIKYSIAVNEFTRSLNLNSRSSKFTWLANYIERLVIPINIKTTMEVTLKLTLMIEKINNDIIKTKLIFQCNRFLCYYPNPELLTIINNFCANAIKTFVDDSESEVVINNSLQMYNLDNNLIHEILSFVSVIYDFNYCLTNTIKPYFDTQKNEPFIEPEPKIDQFITDLDEKMEFHYDTFSMTFYTFHTKFATSTTLQKGRFINLINYDLLWPLALIADAICYYEEDMFHKYLQLSKIISF